MKHVKHVLTAVALMAMASTAHAGTATAIGTGIASSHANASSASSSRSSSNSSVNRSGNSSTTTYATTTGQSPAVFAPGLAAAGIESCNGSVSLGGAAVGGGGALGFPWQDGPCNKRLNARTLWALGQKEAAIQQLCLDDEMAVSLVTAGIHCRIGRYAPQPEQTSSGEAPAHNYTITDRRGRRYTEVACGSPHSVHTTTAGVCARRIASN